MRSGCIEAVIAVTGVFFLVSPRKKYFFPSHISPQPRTSATHSGPSVDLLPTSGDTACHTCKRPMHRTKIPIYIVAIMNTHQAQSQRGEMRCNRGGWVAPTGPPAGSHLLVGRQDCTPAGRIAQSHWLEGWRGNTAGFEVPQHSEVPQGGKRRYKEVQGSVWWCKAVQGGQGKRTIHCCNE